MAVNRGSKTAIITGGSRGIGAAIANRLAADGFNIVVGYASADPSDATSVVECARASGVGATAYAGDVADPACAKAMFDLAEAAYGGIDVLVNNAGVMILGRISEMEDLEFDREVAVNLKGTFNFMREAARRIRDGGRIVNISTSAIGSKRESYGVYASTKAAVEVLSQILAREMRGRQVSVNSVAPGATATKLLLDSASPEFLAQIAKSGPYERLGTPEDIAATVGFLCSDGGAWINGQVIRVNGGTI